MSEELTEFVVEAVPETHEVVVQSEPSPAKKRRPPVDRTTDEYRRHRDRNNDAVRRCRERLQQRNRDRQRMLEDVIEEKAALLTRVMQLTDDLRQISEAERKRMEEKLALQEQLKVAEKECERLREHARQIKGDVQAIVDGANVSVDPKKLEKIMEKSELLQTINTLESELHTTKTEKNQLEAKCDTLKEEVEMWRKKAIKSEDVAPPMIYQIVQTGTVPTETTVVTSAWLSAPVAYF